MRKSAAPVISDQLKLSVVALSATFFVVDPLANVPIFLSVTRRFTPDERRRAAARAAITAWVTLCLFAAAGGVIFDAFGISLGAFKIAGGIMLLLMAIDMMRAQSSPTRTTEAEQDESRARNDVDELSIVPLAIPMLAGPGAIATVMVLMSRAEWRPIATTGVFVAVTVTCFVAWMTMRSAASAERFLPKTLLHAFERVMGLLLAAVAVEFVAGGVRDLI